MSTTETLVEAATAPADPPPVRALGWLDPEAPARARTAEAPLAPAMLPRRRRRFAPAIPAGILAALAVGYLGATLAYPLDALHSTVVLQPITVTAPPASAFPWPQGGESAVAVQGVGSLGSTREQVSMASITKVITSLMVLEEKPLLPGEQGPSFDFTRADSNGYWRYLQNDESALDVPVGGSLTQYQLLQGVLLGSAGNYADYLAEWVWGTRDAYARAARGFLEKHGISGITVVEPTGIDPRDTATPEALTVLAEVALRNPVFAQIVAMKEVDLPGAGHVVNTNPIIADPGVVGVKTGRLDGWNLLATKDVDAGGTTVRLHAAVIDFPSADARSAAIRGIFDEAAKRLQPTVAVPAGTAVAEVTSYWGSTARIVTTGDVSLISWNGSSGSTTPAVSVGDRAAGAAAGSLTVTGRLNAATVPLVLEGELADPSPWWRLTHPLDLWGVNR